MVKDREKSADELLTYCPLPYCGVGPGQTCMSLLENIPVSIFHKTLVLPSSDRAIAKSIDVKQTIPFILRIPFLSQRLPYNYERGVASLNSYFPRMIETCDPSRTIAYFWGHPPQSLIRAARNRGLMTVREMINTCMGTVKAVLDNAYQRHGFKSGQDITEESVEREREELALYDYIFASNPMVESSLLEAGIDASRIIASTFGWTQSRYAIRPDVHERRPFRALFVGVDAVRKGVPELLAAWKKSGVEGELVLAGPGEGAIEPLLKSYVGTNTVRVLSFERDIGSLYRSADIFVFPTLEEGGPQVTYEAAGCGLPIITTPMGAARLIENEVNGLIVEPADIDGLANAISRLATSRELRERLGRQAAIDAQNFTYERVGIERAKKLSALLRDRRA